MNVSKYTEEESLPKKPIPKWFSFSVCFHLLRFCLFLIKATFSPLPSTGFRLVLVGSGRAGGGRGQGVYSVVARTSLKADEELTVSLLGLLASGHHF